MPSDHPNDQLRSQLERARGRVLTRVQVLGVNSLKTLEPPLSALEGANVVDTALEGRIAVLTAGSVRMECDLQRTGKLVWRESAEPWDFGSPGVMPTLRLLFADGGGLDLIEPARTKRITLTLRPSPTPS
jgi:hypothetical protein